MTEEQQWCSADVLYHAPRLVYTRLLWLLVHARGQHNVGKQHSKTNQDALHVLFNSTFVKIFSTEPMREQEYLVVSSKADFFKYLPSILEKSGLLTVNEF